MSLGRVATLVVAVAALAGLDFFGTFCAKEYADHRRPIALAVGLVTFVALFGVYILSLRVAELSMVTMAWVVLLQVGVLALDQHRYGLTLSGSQRLAVGAVLALQCWLIATTGDQSPRPEAAPAMAGTTPGGQRPSSGATAALGLGAVTVAHAERHRRSASTTIDLRAAPATGHATPLVGEAPTPYLVVDLDAVADRYHRLTRALPGVEHHYAVKANPTPALVRHLVRQGAAFDVASPAEITTCLAAGADPARLAYGNTAKKVKNIAFAHALGVATFTFDHGSELDKLLAAAPGATLCCRLATSGHGADWALSTKFGCPPEEALGLLRRAAAAGHPVGLAFHVGSQQRDPHQWDEPLRAVGRLQARLADLGIPLDLVNIGGGFPARYREPTEPIEAYGAAIGAALARHLAPGPRILAEPGRYLAAEAGIIEAEVVLVADRGGRRWVHVDIGRYGGLAETLGEAIRYRVTTDRDGGPTTPVVLAGPTCDSTDILYQDTDYWLPADLAAGDRIWFHATGAYTATYASVGFNGLPPLAVHCIGGDQAPPGDPAPDLGSIGGLVRG